ncbi:MAG: hypothetical protein CM15mP87_09220 [Candidatus Neomarinimicrobiota bacterium]|nr:MAG: hypothetical protein CM15mP87_09220 [Candidatus Neomarinimicrobiota bacterium]
MKFFSQKFPFISIGCGNEQNKNPNHSTLSTLKDSTSYALGYLGSNLNQALEIDYDVFMAGPDAMMDGSSKAPKKKTRGYGLTQKNKRPGKERGSKSKKQMNFG